MAKIIDDSLGPIGAVVSSLLTQAQFQSLYGAGWILADGRSITGTVYATVTGSTTAPDLRGQILRGKNNTRADGNQNPDGDLALGTFQSHATSKNGLALSDPGHSHAAIGNANGADVVVGIDAGAASTGGSYSGIIGVSTTGIALGTGDNETRMRNVTVNHFLRVS